VRPLNFARRPFRNENLPRLAWGLAWTLLVAGTVAQAVALRELLAGSMARRTSEVGTLDRERAALRNEADSLRRVKTEADAVGRWRILKGLVDQRMMAWTELLASLEDALPSGVRLTSISPSFGEGRNRLDLLAVAFAMDDALELVKALQARPEFSEVYPLSISETGRGLEVRCSMVYSPGKRSRPPVSAPPEEGPR
jgi:Tfp pilus assembly protein PilN